MLLHDSTHEWISLIAAASDLCLKPWKHGVVSLNDDCQNKNSSENNLDLVLRIECRSSEGDRHPENDLELEIYRSGNDLNLTLSWYDQPERPILWQGKHSLWMDAVSGRRCQPPVDGSPLEALARRIRSLFLSNQEI